jgi:hypothetical protein
VQKGEAVEAEAVEEVLDRGRLLLDVAEEAAVDEKAFPVESQDDLLALAFREAALEQAGDLRQGARDDRVARVVQRDLAEGFPQRAHDVAAQGLERMTHLRLRLTGVSDKCNIQMEKYETFARSPGAGL